MAQSIPHQQQLLRDSWLSSTASVTSPAAPGSMRYSGTSSNNNDGGRGCETIHSGQFMVSHFEAEAQDDEDTEIEMPDPDENAAVELNTCTDVQLLPSGSNSSTSTAIVAASSRSSSSAVIDISLAKLFKCMNLAYRQKLTSPKWNSFKGIRLRWKDKIRLNNLIWRCWHMQFILKKKTPVCQFASPLDVDLHSKPEAVVLEGKYWKRQFDVIKAEYMKWRKFYRNRGLGNNSILDTMSEIDIFDWSPTTNDKSLMSMDDYCWTADTLFSTINTPFPFPDPREIAKAGIADFIQPSLGPLQPNLDDFMSGIPLQELFNSHLSSRLPPVPEEGSDDVMFRSDVYDFPAIMGGEPMDAAIISDNTSVTDVSSGLSQAHQSQPQDVLLCSTQSSATLQAPNNSGMLQFTSAGAVNPNVLQYSNKMYGSQNIQQVPQPMNAVMNASSSAMAQQVSLQAQMPLNQSSGFMNAASDGTAQTSAADMLNMVSTKKRPMKDRSIRSHLVGRREPHNYDKSTPTQHQTNIYNQMLAQQNRGPMQLDQLGPDSRSYRVDQLDSASVNLKQQLTGPMSTNCGIGNTNSTNFNSTNLYLTPQNAQTQLHTSPIQTTTNNYMNALNLSSNNNFVLQTPNQMNQNMINMMASNSVSQQSLQQTSTPQSPQTLKQNSNLLSLLSMKSPPNVVDIDRSSSDSFKAASAAHQNVTPYKPYPTQQSFKSSVYGQLSPRSMRLSSPPSHQLNPLLSDQQRQAQQMSAADKEMYRSKSLPLNSTLQMPISREEPFAVPKYQAAKSSSVRFRVRSNSMVSKHHGPNTPSLQNAASEPMLKTLAQLLTSSGSSASASASNQKQSCLANNIVSQANIVTPQQQKQRSFILQQSSSSASSIMSPTSMMQMSPNSSSPLGSYGPSSSSGINLTSTPSLSPESLHEQESPLSPSRGGLLAKYQRGASSSGAAGTLASSVSPGPNAGSDSTQRRVGHIHAEQKRRYNIKNGFDMLHSLIPQLQQNPNAKLSKAAMLQKGAEYIRQLRTERDGIKQKMEILRKERDSLNNSLNHLHAVLPANGAPVARQRTGRVKELYSDYVRERTLRNWKFWILGLIFEPLLNSYNTTVSVASMEELYRSTMIWVDQHCSLVEIRPAVSDKLRYLSTTTDILSDPPSTLQEEVLKAISASNSNPSNL